MNYKEKHINKFLYISCVNTIFGSASYFSRNVTICNHVRGVLYLTSCRIIQIGLVRFSLIYYSYFVGFAAYLAIGVQSAVMWRKKNNIPSSKGDSCTGPNINTNIKGALNNNNMFIDADAQVNEVLALYKDSDFEDELLALGFCDDVVDKGDILDTSISSVSHSFSKPELRNLPARPEAAHKGNASNTSVNAFMSSNSDNHLNAHNMSDSGVIDTESMSMIEGEIECGELTDADFEDSELMAEFNEISGGTGHPVVTNAMSEKHTAPINAEAINLGLVDGIQSVHTSHNSVPNVIESNVNGVPDNTSQESGLGIDCNIVAPEAAVPAPHSTSHFSNLAPNTPPYGTYSYSKQMALQLKQEGRTKEAVKWAKYAKEQQLTEKQQVLKSTGKSGLNAVVSPPVENPKAKNSMTQAAGGCSSNSNNANADAGPHRPGNNVKLPPADAVPSGSYVHAKQVALALKNVIPPRNKEALLWAKYAKQKLIEEQTCQIRNSGVEEEADALNGTIVASAPNASLATEADIYTPLEVALTEACTQCLTLIKQKQHSKHTLLLYKTYMNDIRTLRARRAMLQSNCMQSLPVPMFEWKTTTRVVQVTNDDLALDVVKLHIRCLLDGNSMLHAHKRKQFKVRYNMSIPKDSPITGETGLIDCEGEVDGATSIEYSLILNIKRSRVLTLSIARKQAVFEIVLPSSGFLGFGSSEKTIGYAQLPLKDLATKCDVEVACDITDQPGGRSSRKSLEKGSKLLVHLSIRKPYEIEKESRNEVEKVLTIDPASWSVPQANPVSNTAPAPVDEALPDKLMSFPSTTVTSTPVPTPGVPPTPLTAPPPAAALTRVSAPAIELLELEMKDPLGVQYLESSDVMDHELQATCNQLEKVTKALGKATGEAAAALKEELLGLKLRKQLIETKSNILVTSVQNEQLSLEGYLDKVRDRLARDKALALYFSKKVPAADEDPNANRNTALLIMKRVQIMQQEIAGAESENEASDVAPEAIAINDPGDATAAGVDAVTCSLPVTPVSISVPPPAATLTRVSAPAIELLELEMKDPLGVQYLESSDVMDHELQATCNQLEKVTKALGSAKSASCIANLEDERYHLSLRKQLIETKSNILVTSVQNEQLSLEGYLDKVRDRLARDKALALYFSKKVPAADEDPNANRNTALLIMKRVQIMQQEIAGAESENEAS